MTASAVVCAVLAVLGDRLRRVIEADRRATLFNRLADVVCVRVTNSSSGVSMMLFVAPGPAFEGRRVAIGA